MRIAVFGDVHGNLPALRAVLAAIHARRPDAVVCLGDLAFKGPWPGECLEAVAAEGIPCVFGNTDLVLLAAASESAATRVPEACRPSGAIMPYLRWHLRRMSPADLDHIAALPAEHRMEADGVRLLFTHAAPGDCNASLDPSEPGPALDLRLQAADADLVAVGHVHHAYAFRRGGRMVLNPGGTGTSQDRDWRAGYAWIDTGDASVQLCRVPYAVEAAVAASRERRFCFDPDWYGAALRSGFWQAVPWRERAAIDGPLSPDGTPVGR